MMKRGIVVSVIAIAGCAAAKEQPRVLVAASPHAVDAGAAIAEAGAPASSADEPLGKVDETEGIDALGFSADGQLLRIATLEKLVVIDTKSRVVVGTATYPEGGAPSFMSTSADDKQLRLVSSQMVLVYDGANAKLIETKKFASKRTFVARSRDVLVAFAGEETEENGAPKGELSMLDLVTLTEKRLPKSWGGSEDMSLTARGDRLLTTTTGANSSSASLFDLATQKRIATLRNPQGIGAARSL